MDVAPGAEQVVDRLRHERRPRPVDPGDVLDRVLQQGRLVGRGGQVIVLDRDLVLTRATFLRADERLEPQRPELAVQRRQEEIGVAQVDRAVPLVGRRRSVRCVAKEIELELRRHPGAEPEARSSLEHPSEHRREPRPKPGCRRRDGSLPGRCRCGPPREAHGPWSGRARAARPRGPSSRRSATSPRSAWGARRRRRARRAQGRGR